jgi:two-component system sensor histidine kinase HydH
MVTRGGRRWDLVGLAAGAALGFADLAVFLAVGLDMRLAGRDVTLLVMATFILTYAAFGWVIGRLMMARRTIQDQLEALAASQRAALQNEKLAAIGRLAAGIAHEVRNPLGVIRASAVMVRESFAPGDEAYRACEFIREEIDRLNGLITALLGFARPTEPRLRPVRLDDVVERALGLAADDLGRRGIAVARAADGAPSSVPADPDLLAQVVLGLVTNAAEALGESGRIEIRLARDPAGVALDVADSGPGVPADRASQLFEPFFTTKPTGTGLGLAMAARIVQAHGGSIETVAGRGAGPGGAGACFRIRLRSAA